MLLTLIMLLGAAEPELPVTRVVSGETVLSQGMMVQYSHSTLLGAVAFTLVLYFLSKRSKKRTPLKFILIAGVAYFVVSMLRAT